MTTTGNYKVLIPTAGTGSRLGNLTKYLNKSLIDVSGKPVISRIIENFPAGCEFVIPLGYRGELVKQFLSLAYPDKKFYFTTVEKYEGEGSGLGLTILSAEKYLQEPFVFCSCDTIVEGEIPFPDRSIAGFAQRQNKNQYRTLEIQGDKVYSLLEKNEATENSMPYIGLVCINDWKLFWQLMHEGAKQAIEIGESYPLKIMAQKNLLFAKKFIWYDTGNLEELEQTRSHFKGTEAPNILPKPNEAIWFVNDKVIKYCDDKNFIKDRVERTKYLKGYVPEIKAFTPNMYAYDKANGVVLSKIKDVNLFKDLLNYSKNFWQQTKAPENFREICKNFYYDKTLKRIDLYYKTFGQADNITVVNGKKLPKLSEILNRIDWENIFCGLSGRFHGDFHFENILHNENTNKFIFLDWRQNFGGLLECGDIYYDLAKLLHGLIISHEIISANKFNIKMTDNEIEYTFERKPILIDCEKFYYNWLNENGCDVQKVKIITALIYLNIAPLHHYPYCHLLYYLGKTMLFENSFILKTLIKN